MEMKPVVTDNGISFKLKIELSASAIECEAIIKELQEKANVKIK